MGNGVPFPMLPNVMRAIVREHVRDWNGNPFKRGDYRSHTVLLICPFQHHETLCVTETSHVADGWNGDIVITMLHRFTRIPA